MSHYLRETIHKNVDINEKAVNINQVFVKLYFILL
jgi:hypothetical protein